MSGELKIENNAAVTNQTIINIQNMSGNVGVPDNSTRVVAENTDATSEINPVQNVWLIELSAKLSTFYGDEYWDPSFPTAAEAEAAGAYMYQQGAWDDFKDIRRCLAEPRDIKNINFDLVEDHRKAYYDYLRDLLDVGIKMPAKEPWVQDFFNKLSDIYNAERSLKSLHFSADGIYKFNEVGSLKPESKQLSEHHLNEWETCVERFLRIGDDIKMLIDDFIASLETASIAGDYSEYIVTLKQEYSKIRTLLYDKVPKDFYSFYVCNDLKYEERIISSITTKHLLEFTKRIIITGIGGLGKSMMMRHLLLDALNDFESLRLLPIFVPLKNYGDDENSLLDFIFVAVKKFDPNMAVEHLNAALKSGSCLLFFDGVDEVKSSKSAEFARGLDAFVGTYPHNSFVLSSRPSTRLIAFERFAEIELQPFSREQALQMIDNFVFSNEDKIVRQKFRERLENDLWFSHEGFAENPLLLTLMLMTFEEFSEVPSKIHKFYELAFETLARKHDDTKRLEREYKSGLKKDEIADLLARICFLSYQEEKYELTDSEFKLYFERCYKDQKSVSASDFLQDLCDNLCLLIAEGGKYRFIHRSFQEYFCAMNIRRGFEKVSVAKKKLMVDGLVAFFDRRRESMKDNVLEMLYDMVQEKVEEFIIIPKLEQLFGDENLADDNGYWRVIERAFPSLKFWYEFHPGERNDPDDLEEGEELTDESYYDFSLGNDGFPQSMILYFVMYSVLHLDEDEYCDETYYENTDIMDKVPEAVSELRNIIRTEAKTRIITDESGEGSTLAVVEYSTFVELSKNHTADYFYDDSSDNGVDLGEHEYWVQLEAVRENSDKHSALIAIINHPDFRLRKVCLALRQYLDRIKAKQIATDNEWIEDFLS